MALKCPKCGNEESYVVDVRRCKEGIRRRRKCDMCETRYTTYESCDSIPKEKAAARMSTILVRNLREAIAKSFKEYSGK